MCAACAGGKLRAMNYFVPYPRPIIRPPRVLAVLALCAGAALLAPSPGHALTRTDHLSATGGDRFTVQCDQTATVHWTLPAGATNVKITAPVAGQVVKDGFGRDDLARIESVTPRSESGRTVVDVTARGIGQSCSYPGDWDSNGVEFRATYDRTVDWPVLLSDDFAFRGRQRPARLTAAYQTGWRNLRWSSWGGRSAVATGTFVGERVVAVGPYAKIRKFSYPVRVTVSKPRLCGDGYQYSRIHTSFLKATPAVIRRQAKPPGAASCLKAG
jgi:hypothetical protein